MHPITLVVADDHTLLRKGVVSLLRKQSRVKVVGEACDGLEAVEQVRLNTPEVVLMDLKMPRCDGVAATRTIMGRFPSVGVVILTVSDNDEDLVAAVEAGAKGYVLKNATLDELLRAIEAAAVGETALSPAIATKVLRWMNGRSRAARDKDTTSALLVDSEAEEAHPAIDTSDVKLPADGVNNRRSPEHLEYQARAGLGEGQDEGVIGDLTRREVQVLRLLAQGAGTRAIGDKLSISSATARHHIDSILSKLGVHSRLEAVAHALRHRLV